MTLWIAIGATALVVFALKAVGPVALAGRELAPGVRAVITLLTPTLLAGLVVAEIAGPKWGAADSTVLAGLATALALRLLRAPLLVALVGAAAATAALRLMSG